MMDQAMNTFARSPSPTDAFESKNVISQKTPYAMAMDDNPYESPSVTTREGDFKSFTHHFFRVYSIVIIRVSLSVPSTDESLNV